MKATIHFTNTKVFISYSEDDGETLISVEVTDQRPQLERLLLLAAIEKEAEEKYPEYPLEINVSPGTVRLYNSNAENNRSIFIETWQSLINKIPSEEDFKKRFCDPFWDSGKRAWYIKGRLDQIKELLPSLPSTANCEVELNEEIIRQNQCVNKCASYPSECLCEMTKQTKLTVTKITL